MSWSPRRRRVWVLALALALAGGALKWWVIEWALQPSPAARVVEPAPRPKALTASAPAASASRAREFGDAVPTPTHPAPDLSPRALRMQSDWCGFGAAEAARDEDAVSRQGNPMAAGQDAVQTQTDGEQVLALAREKVLQRWMETLRRRGDTRALAMAEWLGLFRTDARGELERGQARLQALAATSTDPMVTVLSLGRPCKPGVCRNVEVSQWSRLEPENVLAWLALAGTPGHTPDYLLERMATVGRYSRSYQQEAGQMLLSVLQFDTPGLDNQAESTLLISVAGAWEYPRFAPLMAACRTPEADAVTRSRCEVVATRLWSQGNMLERAIALSVAGHVVPKTAPERGAWEARAVEYEAVRLHEDGRLPRMMDQMVSELAAKPPCEGLPLLRRWSREPAERSDWDRGRAELQAGGADLGELSRQWRSKEGRSALEPRRPPVRAASAAR